MAGWIPPLPGLAQEIKSPQFKPILHSAPFRPLPPSLGIYFGLLPKNNSMATSMMTAILLLAGLICFVLFFKFIDFFDKI
jgi:hypothetical protein